MRDQDRGRAYENRLAKERQMEKQPFSGAGKFKEDLIGKWELLQAKSTGNDKTYTLHRDDLVNVVLNAMRCGRTGVLFLEWGPQEYVIMRRQDYENNVRYEESIHCQKCACEVKEFICDDCRD